MKYIHPLISMVKNFSVVLLTGLLFLLSSCAVNRKLDFQGKVPDNQVKTPVAHTLYIMGSDQREAVVNKKQKPQICGAMYSTVMIRYNVKTKSGLPLANEFAESFKKSLVNKGAALVTVLDNPSNDTTFQSGPTSQNTEGYYVLLEIKKWESKSVPEFSRIRYFIVYDLDAKVFNSRNELLTTSRSFDYVEIKGGNDLNPLSRLNKYAAETFYKAIDKITGEIAGSL